MSEDSWLASDLAVVLIGCLFLVLWAIGVLG